MTRPDERPRLVPAAAQPDAAVTQRRLLAAAMAALIIAADQTTKAWVLRVLPDEGMLRPVLPGCLNLVHRRNPGIAFSLFHDWRGAPVFFAIFAVAAALFVAGLLVRYRTLPWKIVAALALVAGGALGNVIDRVTPPHTVFDFIDCYLGTAHWPAFNVADSAICIGAGLLLLASFTDPSAFSPPASSRPASSDSAR